MDQNQKALKSLWAQVDESKKICEEFFARESESVVRVARMIRNGYGYDYNFSRGVEAFGCNGDSFIGGPNG